MFDKLNIIINNELEIKKDKNLFLEIFSNKYEIAIITFLIYLSGVLYQILKLIGGLKVSPVLGNLYFFNFGNTINDFLIIFGYSFLMFILSFTIVFSPIYLLDTFVYLKGKSKIFIGFCFIVGVLSIYGLMYYRDSSVMKNMSIVFVVMVPYILSIILSIITLIQKGISKTIFYIFFGLFYVYGFLAILYGSGKYYGCINIEQPKIENCILIEYKNDKYGFTGKGDVYNLDEFKSFYTSNYFLNLNGSGSVSK